MDTSQLKTQLGHGKPGTYILCLKLANQQLIQISKLGQFTLKVGYYYYVGSAFGPGGVAARCAHHSQISSRPRWHIDYLRAKCQLQQIVYSLEAEHLEHQWASHLNKLDETSLPVVGFGVSDCDCESHLFF